MRAAAPKWLGSHRATCSPGREPSASSGAWCTSPPVIPVHRRFSLISSDARRRTPPREFGYNCPALSRSSPPDPARRFGQVQGADETSEFTRPYSNAVFTKPLAIHEIVLLRNGLSRSARSRCRGLLRVEWRDLVQARRDGRMFGSHPRLRCVRGEKSRQAGIALGLRGLTNPRAEPRIPLLRPVGGQCLRLLRLGDSSLRSPLVLTPRRAPKADIVSPVRVSSSKSSLRCDAL